jgi:hypothetical protein
MTALKLNRPFSGRQLVGVRLITDNGQDVKLAAAFPIANAQENKRVEGAQINNPHI